MFEKEVIVCNQVGLHARPASLFVEKAKSFEADIEVEHMGNHRKANAKSIISILALGAVQGTRLTIRANGPDGSKAVTELITLLENDCLEMK